MTISVYEFAQYDTFSGLPVHPPSKVTLAAANIIRAVTSI